MIQTNTLDNGEHCVTATAEDPALDLEIRIHWHQPGVNLVGFQVFIKDEFIAGMGDMNHDF